MPSKTIVGITSSSWAYMVPDRSNRTALGPSLHCIVANVGPASSRLSSSLRIHAHAEMGSSGIDGLGPGASCRIEASPDGTQLNGRSPKLTSTTASSSMVMTGTSPPDGKTPPTSCTRSSRRPLRVVTMVKLSSPVSR